MNSLTQGVFYSSHSSLPLRLVPLWRAWPSWHSEKVLPRKRCFSLTKPRATCALTWFLAWMLDSGGPFTSESAISYTMSGFPAGTMAVGTGFLVRPTGSEAVCQVPGVVPRFDAAVASRSVNQVASDNFAVHNPLPSRHQVVGALDFSGDSVADLLAQSPVHTLSAWLLERDPDPSGETHGSDQVALGMTTIPGSNRFVGAPDVTGDGLADGTLQQTQEQLPYGESTGTNMQRGTNGNPVRELLCDVGSKRLNKPGAWSVIGSRDGNSDGSLDPVFEKRRHRVPIPFGISTAMSSVSGPSPDTSTFANPMPKFPLALASFRASRFLGPLAQDSST